MKKAFVFGIVVLGTFILAASIYALGITDSFRKTNVEYYGVEGETFFYDIEENGLSCRLDYSESIKNGDTATLYCEDKTGLVNMERSFYIEGLLSYDTTSDIFYKLVTSKFWPNTAYVKSDDKGIHLLVISEDGESYSSYAYDNLFYSNDVIYQVDNISDRESYDTILSVSYYATNILAEYLDEYIELYQAQGYEIMS